MTDERVWEAELRYENPDCHEQGWTFIGNFTEVNWMLGQSFENVARERGWPAGEYRLVRVTGENYGDFWLYTLSVRSDPVYEAVPSQGTVEDTHPIELLNTPSVRVVLDGEAP